MKAFGRYRETARQTKSRTLKSKQEPTDFSLTVFVFYLYRDGSQFYFKIRSNDIGFVIQTKSHMVLVSELWMYGWEEGAPGALIFEPTHRMIRTGRLVDLIWSVFEPENSEEWRNVVSLETFMREV